jgi:hypothetical protein
VSAPSPQSRPAVSLPQREPHLPEAAREILEAGRPAVGYTRDRALAAVTPLAGSGRLAVEITPRTVAADEAPETGDSYERWQWEILPAEVDAHGPPHFEDDLLRELHDELDEFMTAWREAAPATEGTGERLTEEAAVAARVGAEMEALEVSGPERTLLLAPLQSWVTMHDIVDEHVAELSELVDALHRTGSRAGFHVALARLHAIAADTEPNARLIDALRVDADDLAARAAERERLAARVGAKVRSLISLMGVPSDVITGWLEDTDFASFPPGAHRLVEEVRSASANTAASISELEALAERVAGEPGPRPEGLRTRVEAVAARLG